MLPASERIVQALKMMNGLRTPVLMVWLALLSACETMGPAQPPVDVNALEQEAERLLEEEEFEQALQIYARLADAADGGELSGFLIAGAEILVVLGAYDTAGEWLTRAGGEATPDQARRIMELHKRIRAALSQVSAPLNRVALLLPLTGPQRQAAIAIQDGFLAAHLGPSGAGAPGRLALHIYDTGLLGAQEAYLAARDDGAEFIVGPLLKPELAAIMDSAGTAPTLALNTLEDGRSAANLYQFALAPEDEASQVARYAAANGASNAVALIPRDDWGDRLLGSFRTELEALGGQLLEIRTYDPAGQDFSTAITTVLNIDRSDRRRQQLGADLGIALEFESRRRQDIDAIFVAADAGAGRLLAPQLRFWFADDIPTYATSAIYESSRGNGDLNGLLFADTPWVLGAGAAPPTLAATLRRHWPQRSSAQWTRFYGFGFDAFRLMLALHENPNTLSSFPALSGVLSLDEAGRVRRELPLAQFRDGVPVAVEPAPVAVEPGSFTAIREVGTALESESVIAIREAGTAPDSTADLASVR